MTFPRLTEFGEAAVLVEFSDEPSLALNQRVHALAASLVAAPPAGLRTLVPGAVSLLLELDPLHSHLADLKQGLAECMQRVQSEARSTGRDRDIPTVYGGEFGPDLDEVAARLKMTAADVIARHTANPQTVYMLGFSPGFPYLGDLPPELSLPRRDKPRERVPLGSVAIAGRQTGIYSRETPGGWHVLGRTPVTLFDPRRDPPAYLAPGDRVRFVPVEPDAWDRHAGPPLDW